MSKPWFKPFDDNSKDLESAERIIKKHIEKIPDFIGQNHLVWSKFKVQRGESRIVTAGIDIVQKIKELEKAKVKSRSKVYLTDAQHKNLKVHVEQEKNVQILKSRQAILEDEFAKK